MEEEPQYDYEIPNSDLVSNEKRNQTIISEIRGLFSHVGNKLVVVAGDMSQNNPVPRFDEKLAVPNQNLSVPDLIGGPRYVKRVRRYR